MKARGGKERDGGEGEARVKGIKERDGEEREMKRRDVNRKVKSKELREGTYKRG